MTRIVPMVSCEDVASASEWLQQALGFAEHMRISDLQGRATHVELRRGEAAVMLGWPGSSYRSPRSHADACEDARDWLATPHVVDGVLVEVDDVDGLLDRSLLAGAELLRGPEEAPPGRLAVIADPEGHRWMLLRPRD